jgi:hypothetical protein
MLDVVYGMPEQMVAQMEAVQAMAEKTKSRDDGSWSHPSSGKTEPEIGLEFDPAKLKQAFKRYESQGVRLERADTETRDGWRFTHIKVSFENLKACSPRNCSRIEGSRWSGCRAATPPCAERQAAAEQPPPRPGPPSANRPRPLCWKVFTSRPR